MPLLPLETWRKYFGYHPFHFWGLANETVPVLSGCNAIVRQYAWQHVDAVGRSEIKQSIEAAEARLLEYLGYAVAPRYTSKTVPFPRYSNINLWRHGVMLGADGRMAPVELHDGYIQSVGVEVITSLGDVGFVLSDRDGDGVDDTFTATVATTETDPGNLAVYFVAADRLDSAPLGEDWRIEPVQISIAAGTATVIGRWYTLVKPVKYEGADPNSAPLDPSVAANFAAAITIATRTTLTQGQTVDNAQATLLWETLPCYGWWGCCDNLPVYSGSENDPGAVGMSVARVGIRDAKAGVVLPGQAVYDTTSALWRAVDWGAFREPDRVTVRYLAGYPLENYQVAKKWQTIIARMAAAELARPICACISANQELFHWQFDLSRAAGSNDEQYSIGPADLENPFGTRRGQVWAWKQVKNLTLGHGTLI